MVCLEAGDESTLNRISSPSEDDGDGPARLLGGQRGGRVCDDDNVNLERNQFGRKSGNPVVLFLCISVFDDDVAAFEVTEVTQSLKEGLSQVETSGQVARQVAYSRTLAATCASAASGAEMRLSVRTTASQIRRIGTSVGMAGGESSRRKSISGASHVGRAWATR